MKFSTRLNWEENNIHPDDDGLIPLRQSFNRQTCLQLHCFLGCVIVALMAKQPMARREPAIALVETVASLSQTLLFKTSKIINPGLFWVPIFRKENYRAVVPEEFKRIKLYGRERHFEVRLLKR